MAWEAWGEAWGTLKSGPPGKLPKNAIFKQETHKESVNKNRAWVFKKFERGLGGAWGGRLRGLLGEARGSLGKPGGSLG